MIDWFSVAVCPILEYFTHIGSHHFRSTRGSAPPGVFDQLMGHKRTQSCLHFAINKETIHLTNRKFRPFILENKWPEQNHLDWIDYIHVHYVRAQKVQSFYFGMIRDWKLPYKLLMLLLSLKKFKIDDDWLNYWLLYKLNVRCFVYLSFDLYIFIQAISMPLAC